MEPVTPPSLWTPDLAVGSLALDNRNRAIFSQLAKAPGLIATSDAGQLTRSLQAVFTQFEQLLLEEEAELAEIAYPELAFHRQLHEQGRNIIRHARLQLARCDSPALLASLTQDSCAELSLWLMRHVIDVDQFFFPYIDARFRAA